MKNKILTTSAAPSLIPRLIVGIVFLTEGIQKFLFADLGVNRFTKVGFGNPDFLASFTGAFEIICGVLLLIGLLTRLAAIPPLIIMIVAFVTTKWPMLMQKGFWPMMHEYRTDYAMTLLLIFLLMQGGGKYSLDYKLFKE